MFFKLLQYLNSNDQLLQIQPTCPLKGTTVEKIRKIRSRDLNYITKVWNKSYGIDHITGNVMNIYILHCFKTL